MLPSTSDIAGQYPTRFTSLMQSWRIISKKSKKQTLDFYTIV
jgi:hypothetical protein